MCVCVCVCVCTNGCKYIRKNIFVYISVCSCVLEVLCIWCHPEGQGMGSDLVSLSVSLIV